VVSLVGVIGVAQPNKVKVNNMGKILI
jgi:hypothetical protein